MSSTKTMTALAVAFVVAVAPLAVAQQSDSPPNPPKGATPSDTTAKPGEADGGAMVKKTPTRVKKSGAMSGAVEK